MALTRTHALNNAGLDGMYDGFDSGKIQGWSGAPPGANAAPTGTKLFEEDLPADAFAAAASSSKAKNGTWQTTGLAAGTLGYFRIIAAGDTGASSQTEKREEGTITATGGGGDLTVDNVSIAIGQTITITGYTRTL